MSSECSQVKTPEPEVILFDLGLDEKKIPEDQRIGFKLKVRSIVDRAYHQLCKSSRGGLVTQNEVFALAEKEIRQLYVSYLPLESGTDRVVSDIDNLNRKILAVTNPKKFEEAKELLQVRFH